MIEYGKDTWCQDTLRTGRYASGVLVVAQNCYHRLITPRGTLRGGPDEGNYGLDLAGMCGAAVTVDLERAMPARIENELRKDPRVSSASVTMSSSRNSDGEVTWTFNVRVRCGAGPFSLVIGVDGASTKLLGLEAQ